MYKVLNEYNIILRPEIKHCKYKLSKAIKYKKPKAITFWRCKLKELQGIYMIFQKQSVQIKLESNLTELEK